jgi:two-component system, CitB family, response regulator MalR
VIRVLIVEDDPMVADINKRYVESVDGFKCVGIASNVTESLAFLDENTVDLVLLDLFMPEKNGMELLGNIRSKKKSLDVMVISAASDIQNIKAALRLGAVDYLIKPFEFQRFQSALRRYQKEHEWMRKQRELSQEELDQLLRNSMDIQAAAELPKGLTKVTLQKVAEQISGMGNKKFSTGELADRVGISRVSIRKYLKFLTDIGYLSMDISYQTYGRPVYEYQKNDHRAERIKPYLEETD